MGFKDEVTVSDVFVATMFQYNGCPCVKVEGFGNSDMTYTFRVPQFDAQIIQEELTANIAVYVNDWIKALKHIQRLQKAAKDSGGVWTSPEYAKAGAA